MIRYTITDRVRPGFGEMHRLVTTLMDPQRYPAHDLVVRYHERWEIEIANDEIKTDQLATLRPTALGSRTPAGAVQEVYGLLLAYNAVRGPMAEAAALDTPLDPRRLGFTHAPRVIREAIAFGDPTTARNEVARPRSDIKLVRAAYHSYSRTRARNAAAAGEHARWLRPRAARRSTRHDARTPLFDVTRRARG